MFLTPNDFTIHNRELIKLNDQGYSFVFFFTNDCAFCIDVKPAFERLSKLIRGVNFSYMDVSQNDWQLRNMALRSNSPITYVPLLLLFVNGRVLNQFFQDEENPRNNLEKMKQFISINTSRPESTIVPQKISTNIPEYSLGIPGNMGERRVCKLYEEAYGQ
jgi:thiol-disulfide isomerase/thioredoxin